MDANRLILGAAKIASYFPTPRITIGREQRHCDRSWAGSYSFSGAKESTERSLAGPGVPFDNSAPAQASHTHPKPPSVIGPKFSSAPSAQFFIATWCG